MPTTYTHDYFGRRVYKQLPREIRQTIRDHRDLYRIGLHGPDILFYFLISKNPVSSHGVKMHNEAAAEYFEKNIKLIRETGDEELLAYILGFACHYMLDSAAHPFVNRMAAEKVISHTLLEKELDRYLMEVTGRDPYTYRPSDVVIPKWHYAKVIHRAIPQISTLNIFITIHFMKWITNFMICHDGGKRRQRMYLVGSLAGKKNAEKLADYFMRHEAAAEAEIPVRKLVHILEETIPEAAYETKILYHMAKEPENGMKLSARWNLDYRGI